MGKIRTRILGFEEIEKQQKEEQKQRSLEKKMKKGDEAEENAPEGQEQNEESKKKMNKKGATIGKKHVVGKKHKEASAKIDKKKLYTLEDAVALLKKVKYTKFEGSFELHLNAVSIGLKGEVELPHSTGKVVRVAVVDEALLDKLENGIIEFDVLVTHPSFMPKLAKYARTLGPKGLMPNPKTGTVSANPEEVAKKFEKGTLRWKTESKFPLIHQMIGKTSAEDKALVENAKAFIQAVGMKNIKNVFITTTMGPGIKIDMSTLA